MFVILYVQVSVTVCDKQFCKRDVYYWFKSSTGNKFCSVKIITAGIAKRANSS